MSADRSAASRTPSREPLEVHDDRRFITSLARGLDVLKAFTDQDERLTLAEISTLVNLPRATVRRCLFTLQQLGYVEVHGRFHRLAPQVLTLARAYLSSSTLPRVLGPFLERLSEQVQESCSVSVLDGGEIIYVARSVRKRVASLHRGVGSRLPAYCTPMGRILLAFLEEKEKEAYLEKVRMDRITAATVTDRSLLRKLLENARNKEFDFSDSEVELDLLAIAVPLRSSSGRVVAALHISAHRSRADRRRMEREFLPAMRQTASDVQPLLPG